MDIAVSAFFLSQLSLAASQPPTASYDLLGTPDTNLSGLKTRMALRVRRSTPFSSSSASTNWPLADSSFSLKMVMYLQVVDEGTILHAIQT